jgi:D-aspartate ligase
MDALLLGASPNSLSAARSLGRAGLRVVIAETMTDLAITRSRFVEQFLQLEDDDAAITARLMELPEARDKPFLLATGDRYALLVARHQEWLAERYCFVTPSYAALDQIIDKAKLYENARRNGFSCPAFYVVKASNDIAAAIANVSTPCYVKPALGHLWRQVKRTKLERADTAADLRRLLETFVAMGLVAIPQEIIPGADSEVFSVTAYVSRSGECLGFRTKRKLRQLPLDAGNGTVQEICDQPEVSELGLKLLAVSGHRGTATVEFRRDQRNGQFVLIEINPRTSLAQELITRSGLDIPLLAYADAKAKPLPPTVSAIPVRWIDFVSDFRAFRQLRRRGQITTWQWLGSIAGCRAFAYFALDDPRPFLTRSWMWLTSWWVRPFQLQHKKAGKEEKSSLPA